MYKNMELRDTVKMMNSADYKERFIAEYMQVKIRYEKLHKMVVRYEAKTLNFTPSCSIDLLKEQKKHMGNYLYCLEVRAEIEGIDLKYIEPSEEYKKYLYNLATTSTYTGVLDANTPITTYGNWSNKTEGKDD
jgi:hypothetical protein